MKNIYDAINSLKGATNGSHAEVIIQPLLEKIVATKLSDTKFHISHYQSEKKLAVNQPSPPYLLLIASFVVDI